ncbi:MAG: hypothetical protein E7466_06485 [Ruminococcaceae bacterium]|nr:hypothetical protein [Oscillospiraceae bacterium]
MAIDQYKRQRRTLQNQIARGRLIFLAVIAVTLINQIILWFTGNYHFLFSAAMPYYLNWLAGQLPSVGFKIVVTLVTLALYGVYGLCLLRFFEVQWMKTTMGMFAIDTALLAIFAFVLLENPLSCLIELLIHGVILALLVSAYRARLRLARLPRRDDL